jgi:hypothetical protein
MEATVLNDILAHDRSFRGVCSRIEEKPGYTVVSNADIALPSTNCVTCLRLAEDGVAEFLRMVASQKLAVVLDSAAKPPDLAVRFRKAGLTPMGREYIGVLDPESLVEPPGSTPRFTAVGPSELKRFIDLATQGIAGESEAARLLWSFRLRNLLFSAYVAETAEGTASGLAVFHCGAQARLLGPFPAGPQTEFVLACRLVSKAWERAQEKGATGLYTLVLEKDIDLVKPLGFRVDESFWFEMYARW